MTLNQVKNSSCFKSRAAKLEDEENSGARLQTEMKEVRSEKRRTLVEEEAQMQGCHYCKR